MENRFSEMAQGVLRAYLLCSLPGRIGGRARETLGLRWGDSILAKVSVIQTGTYWFSVAGIEVASARPSGNRKRRVDMSKDSAKH
jgi:hypothetical protein